jgi:DNA modification methylase
MELPDWWPHPKQYAIMDCMHCAPGDIVLDPFLGSGTTLLACRRTDRIGLGFEINPDYEPIIQERMLEKVPRIESYFEEAATG